MMPPGESGKLLYNGQEQLHTASFLVFYTKPFTQVPLIYYGFYINDKPFSRDFVIKNTLLIPKKEKVQKRGNLPIGKPDTKTAAYQHLCRIPPTTFSFPFLKQT
ncbi:hypothetical protein QS257_07135 [Terrilactibacillus sp. S3-3]|nr:hypothetical protein QS257_07135 [Terrilactibacillus sp. S3-3]